MIESTMTLPKIVLRDEWLAREQRMSDEQELTEPSAKLGAERGKFPGSAGISWRPAVDIGLCQTTIGCEQPIHY